MPDLPTPDLPTLEDAFSPLELGRPGLARSGDEQRVVARVEMGGPARYRFPTIPAASEWAHGVVVDLAESGGCFLVDGGWSLLKRLEEDEWVPLDVEIQVPGERPLRLRTEIMWVQPDGGGEGGLDRVGSRFDAVGPAELERLRKLIAAGRRRS